MAADPQAAQTHAARADHAHLQHAAGATALTDEEARIYDRQIRLWGVDAQQRMRRCRLLVVGLGALAGEVVKNAVLAGFGTVTLLDAGTVGVDDLAAHFLLTEAALGQNRAVAALPQVVALNPLVAVQAETRAVAELPDDYFAGFDIICATRAGLTDLVRLNEIARRAGGRFFCGDVHGTAGFFFADLGEAYAYVDDSVAAGAAAGAAAAGLRTERFVPLRASLETPWAQFSPRTAPVLFLALAAVLCGQRDSPDKPLGDAAQAARAALGGAQAGLLSDEALGAMVASAGCEWSPVCAVVGGMLAQELVKVASGKEAPLNNWFLYDAQRGSGVVERLHGP